MLYLGTSPYEPMVQEMLRSHEIGLMVGLDSNLPKAGWIWALDNGCFAKTWSEAKWRYRVSKDLPRSGCLFAVVPDVVGDHQQTLERFRQYSDFVRDQRYPVAFVAQNGADPDVVPWDDFDCLFVGGDNEFKMGSMAFRLAVQARELGKWVHVGRVNSLRRLRLWNPFADSADGTHISFEPSQGSLRVQKWIRTLRTETRLQLGA